MKTSLSNRAEGKQADTSHDFLFNLRVILLAMLKHQSLRGLVLLCTGNGTRGSKGLHLISQPGAKI